MDLTPPSLTTSPASPGEKGIDSPPLPTSNLSGLSEASAASYPSPDLLDYPFKTVSPYLGHDSLPVTHDVWGSPDTMTSGPHVPITSTMASILPTAEYDPFNSYDTSLSTPFSMAESYPPPHAPSTVGPGLLRTPPPIPRPTSAVPTSVSMEPRHSYSYVQGHMMGGPKLDNLPSYGQTLEAHPFSTSSVPSLGFGAGENAFNSTPQPFFGDSVLPLWPKEEMRSSVAAPSPPAQTSSSTAHPDSVRSARKAAARQQRRMPRKHTTREEANFQCVVKGCGKFFSRSYNFKSHMDTHDDKREYPFPCPLDGCTKRFVRKTDLQRHHQSVHMKERNHRCDFCARLFARKDTLRRHMEDGCSKRFDIGTMDLRSEAANGPGSAKRAAQGKQNPMAGAASPLPPSLSLAPMTAVSGAPGIVLNGSVGAGPDSIWATAR